MPLLTSEWFARRIRFLDHYGQGPAATTSSCSDRSTCDVSVAKGCVQAQHWGVNPQVLFGLDRLCADPSRAHGVRRAGLVTNDAARLASDPTRRSREVLRNALRDAGIALVRLFGPEHGLSGIAADGAPVPDDIDPVTGIPIVSLYGARMRPSSESLRDLDALFFDIPDVGARFYTYSWTLYHVMAACAAVSVPLIVLDRPNPLGGDLTAAEGPVLDMAYRSFIGEDTIPIRHQLTLGELARLWQRERFPAATLRVIPCEGWTRAMHWPDTGLPWVPTSPAMPSVESVQLYPGLCLFEATNMSVGRGTATPFQLVGAPWLDHVAVARDLSRHAPHGAEFEAADFTPTNGPHAAERCHGVRVRVTEAHVVRPVALGLLLMAAIANTHGGQFQWATYPTAANPGGHGHFERLLGRGDLRGAFDATPGAIDSDVVRAWTTTGDWSERVREVLCYV